MYKRQEKKWQMDQQGIGIVDSMEGHDFEYWCADLLRKNGYENVEVTPGSGDQGIDVLAEKDGIKYAIQCKCYSKDLGNTPCLLYTSICKISLWEHLLCTQQLNVPLFEDI